MAVAKTSDAPSYRTEHLSASLRTFSDENVHKPGVLTAITDMDLKNKSIVQFIIAAFYGNGSNDNNKGYVSIVFKCMVPLLFRKQNYFNFSCVVAVRDAAKNKRFVRTFSFPYDPALQSEIAEDILVTYTIDKYIARQTLLEDRDDLLPEDRLKLEVEVNLEAISKDDSVDLEALINSSFEVEESSDGNEIVLFLDSDVAKGLYEVSSVFRALCDTPMIESSRGFVHLPDDNTDAFKSACKIIMGAKTISFCSIDEIFGLYIFADKYDIQNVIRGCRSFFEKILNVKDSWGTFELVEERVENISLVATFFNDDILMGIVDKFLKTQRGNARESRQKCENRKINLGNLKVEYTGLSPYLHFELKDENDDDDLQFDFYQ